MSEEKFEEDRFMKSLVNLKETQEAIQGFSAYCIRGRAHAYKMARCWLKVIKKVKIDQKLVLFYLVNDIVQHSGKRGYTELLDRFRVVVKEAMPHLKEEKIVAKVQRCLDIWTERAVFEAGFIAELSALIDLTPSLKEDQEIVENFQPQQLCTQIKIMKALEDDADYKLKTLKENDLDNQDIEEMKLKLKDKHCGDEFVQEFEDGTKRMEQYIKAIEREITKRRQVIELLGQGKKYYDSLFGEAEIVATAYTNFGYRVKKVQQKLTERMPELEQQAAGSAEDDDEPGTPPLSPDYDAPSPSGDDDMELKLPDEEAAAAAAAAEAGKAVAAAAGKSDLSSRLSNMMPSDFSQEIQDNIPVESAQKDNNLSISEFLTKIAQGEKLDVNEFIGSKQQASVAPPPTHHPDGWDRPPPPPQPTGSLDWKPAQPPGLPNWDQPDAGWKPGAVSWPPAQETAAAAPGSGGDSEGSKWQQEPVPEWLQEEELENTALVRLRQAAIKNESNASASSNLISLTGSPAVENRNRTSCDMEMSEEEEEEEEEEDLRDSFLEDSFPGSRDPRTNPSPLGPGPSGRPPSDTGWRQNGDYSDNNFQEGDGFRGHFDQRRVSPPPPLPPPPPRDNFMGRDDSFVMMPPSENSPPLGPPPLPSVPPFEMPQRSRPPSFSEHFGSRQDSYDDHQDEFNDRRMSGDGPDEPFINNGQEMMGGRPRGPQFSGPQFSPRFQSPPPLRHNNSPRMDRPPRFQGRPRGGGPYNEANRARFSESPKRPRFNSPHGPMNGPGGFGKFGGGEMNNGGGGGGQSFDRGRGGGRFINRGRGNQRGRRGPRW